MSSGQKMYTIIVKDALEYTFTESDNGPEDMASLVHSFLIKV